MKIGLVGPTSQQRSLPFNAARTVNFFPVFDESGKEVSALYGTPGLQSFSSFGAQAARQNFTSANGRCFFVMGPSLIELLSSGEIIERGSLQTSVGNVSMDEVDTQLGLCDGQNVYILNYDDDVFTLVDDEDLPDSIGFLTVADSYFIVTENNTGRFFISSIGDGLQWDALDFATAEKNPDELLAVKNAVGQLWLFGRRTTEIWTNTGARFPFSLISGAVMETGVVAPHSVVDVDNSVYWVGRDKYGDGMVFRAQGFVPQVVSTEPINILLKKATDVANINSYVYQEDGHTFYVLTGGGLETTLVYDIATRQWHERSFNDEGRLSQHLAQCCTFAFGKQLVGDRRNGNIYEMSLDYLSDNSADIISERIYTHISDMDKRVRYNSLDISLEVGVGLQSGQGSDPQISMQLSKDGAKTWSSWFNKPIGKVGKYQTKVSFKRLGIAEQMTFRIRISDPIKKRLTGSYLQ